MSNIDEMRDLVETLNRYRNSYYNYNISLVEDEVYDNLFDKLKELEEKTGIIFPNSPLHTVGYDSVSELVKVKHNHPMLSLNKTKEVKDVISFIGNNDAVIMAKMDGLTCSLRYLDGKLVSAETRGNGEIGEDVLHCAKVINNIPLTINNKNELIIDGEVIITYDDFDRINAELPEDKRYHHPRNLASGSIRQLDSKIAAERCMKFIAWKMVKGSKSNLFFTRWNEMENLGFNTVPLIYLPHEVIEESKIKHAIELIKSWAKEEKYPIDGCVFSYNNIEYGDSLGVTSHHVKSQLAFKFYDDVYETTLRDIEWNTSRTGQINPIAVFDEVDLDGALTSRATLHNISIMKELKLGIGDTITVYRANQVIPKVHENITKSNSYIFPTNCPVCGAPVEIRKDGVAEVMYCTNDSCYAKLLSKFEHFVSKGCMNIDGLSSATLEKFISNGFIKKFADIYHLADYKNDIIGMDGFGEKSYNKLIESIENSRKVTLDNFLTALSIPGIGKKAAKTISNAFKGDHYLFVNAISNGFNFSQLDDFGNTTNRAIHAWWDSKDPLIELLPAEMKFSMPDDNQCNNTPILGKIFVITGAFTTMTRSEAEKLITTNGGKVSSSVSSKTNYLLTNETVETSKYKKAKELNIPILTEAEFLNMINE